MNNKICTKCGVNTVPNSYKSWCKECLEEIHQEYIKTKSGLISVIYGSQKQRSERRGHKLPTYTKKELFDWVISKALFHKLYNVWVISGFQTGLKPSIDRKDDYKGYSLDNIQLTTVKQNIDRYKDDQKKGINNKRNIAILQLDTKTEKVIKEFYSTRQAERETGIAHSNIVSVLKGRKKTAGGFKWVYKN